MKDTVPLTSIYDGQRCIGFLLRRGKSGVEAYDADCISLGLFPTEGEAANAVSGAAPIEARDTAAPGAVAGQQPAHPATERS